MVYQMDSWVVRDLPGFAPATRGAFFVKKFLDITVFVCYTLAQC